LGAWLRMGFSFWGQWWFVLAGQLIIFSSAPMPHNIIGLISNTWFPEKERATASALMIMANTFSVVVAYVILGYFSKEYFPDNAPPELVIEGTNKVIFVQNCITTFFVFFFVLTFREKPKYPPSKMALAIKEHFEGPSLWREIANMVKIRNFMFLCVSFAIMYASVAAIGVCISPLFKPFGYSTFFLSMGAIGCVVSGVVASVIVGIYVDRTKKFLSTLRALTILATFVFLMSLWVVPLDVVWIATITLVLAGIATVPVTPLGFVFSIELTHPL
jgi:hypothetical protein